MERSKLEQWLGAASIFLSIAVMLDAWSEGAVRRLVGRVLEAGRQPPAEPEPVYGVAEAASAILEAEGRET